MAEKVPQTATELRDWLRGLKEQSGSSYADIARAIKEEERVVKRWMTGEKPSVPRGDSLLRLLDYLGVTLTPPAPRQVALSLMGEIRDVQETLHRIESGADGSTRKSLPEIDRRLEELVDKVAEAIELRAHEVRQARAGDGRKRGKAGQ